MTEVLYLREAKEKFLEDYEKELGNKKTSNKCFRFHTEKRQEILEPGLHEEPQYKWLCRFTRNLKISSQRACSLVIWDFLIK